MNNHDVKINDVINLITLKGKVIAINGYDLTVNWEDGVTSKIDARFVSLAPKKELKGD